MNRPGLRPGATASLPPAQDTGRTANRDTRQPSVAKRLQSSLLLAFQRAAQLRRHARRLRHDERDLAVGREEARALADVLHLARYVAIAAHAGDLAVGGGNGYDAVDDFGAF